MSEAILINNKQLRLSNNFSNNIVGSVDESDDEKPKKSRKIKINTKIPKIVQLTNKHNNKVLESEIDNNNNKNESGLSNNENKKNEYDTTKTLNQNIGTSYEYFVLDEIRNDYDEVWHWSKFPEKILYDLKIIKNYEIYSKYREDIGADLVAKKGDEYIFIQCKNYSDTIMMKDLAGFYFFICEYNLSGVLYYNGQLSQRVKDLSNGRVMMKNLPFNTQNVLISKNKILNSLQNRQYQIDAFEKLNGVKNALLDMPCGTGKLFVCSLLGKEYDNIIILSPLRSLAQQCLSRMFSYLNGKYEPILISCDGIRDKTSLKKVIKSKNIISVTYDSVDILLQIIDLLKNIYVVVDECHNLSKNNLENSEDNIYKLLKLDNNVLYMSATPKNKIKYDKIYKYKWETAINCGYICDIKILVPDVDEKFIEFKNFLVSMNVSENIDVKILFKAFFIVRSILFNGNKKCICFLPKIEKSLLFENALLVMIKLFNVKVDIFQLNCNTSKTKRDEIYEHFKSSVNITLILNVHILDEGIDLPECDSVFITNPNNNIENLIQRMCRGNRILKDKKVCYVYLWSTKEKTDDLLKYIFLETTETYSDKVYRLHFDKNNECKVIKNVNTKNVICLPKQIFNKRLSILDAYKYFYKTKYDDLVYEIYLKMKKNKCYGIFPCCRWSDNKLFLEGNKYVINFEDDTVSSDYFFSTQESSEYNFKIKDICFNYDDRKKFIEKYITVVNKYGDDYFDIVTEYMKDSFIEAYYLSEGYQGYEIFLCFTGVRNLDEHINSYKKTQIEKKEIINFTKNFIEKLKTNNDDDMISTAEIYKLLEHEKIFKYMKKNYCGYGMAFIENVIVENNLNEYKKGKHMKDSFLVGYKVK